MRDMAAISWNATGESWTQQDLSPKGKKRREKTKMMRKDRDMGQEGKD